MKLRPYQSKVYGTIRDHLTDPLVDICVSASRQTGKSLAIQLIALTYISSYGDVGFMEPSSRQCRTMFRDIKAIVESHSNVGSYEFKRGTMEIQGAKGTIFFLSAGSADQLRSMHFGLLIIDEAAYTPEDVIDLVQPFRIATQAPCIYASTKLRKEGRFYEAYTSPNTIVLDTSPEEVIHDFPAYAKVMDLFRSKVSPAIYKVDYLNEFLDNAESLLFGNLNTLVVPHTYSNQHLVVGIDWSLNKSQKDRVSVSLVYRDIDTIVELATYRLNNGQGPLAAVEMVHNLLEPYKPYIKAIYSETNSIGGVQEDALRKMMPHTNIVSAWWNATTKSADISKLIAGCNSGNLHLSSSVNTAKDEMQYYGMTISTTGKIVYGNIRKSDDDNSYHDDSVCALAHAYAGISNPSGTYYIR